MPKRLPHLRIVHKAWLTPAIAVLLFVALASLYNSLVPLFETPDETSHFSVVRYLANGWQLPPMPSENRSGPVPTVTDNPPNYYAPPLYYTLAAPLLFGINSEGFSAAVVPNPYFELGWSISLGDDLTSKNMYVHVSESRDPLAGWATGMQRIRRLSMLFGIITILGAIKLTRLLWSDAKQRGWRVAALALVLFNPTFIFINTGVSNDPLLIALSTWSVTLCAGLLKASDSGPLPRATFNRQILALAILVAAAILTKQSGFLLLLPTGATIWLFSRKESWPRTRLLGTLVVVALILVALGGWWYIYNGIRYGDVLALTPHAVLPEAEALGAGLAFFARQLWGAFMSYWAALGWATIFGPTSWYLALAIFSLVGLSGWLLSMKQQADRQWPDPVSLMIWSLILGNLALLLLWLWRTAAPYGRLMFPVIVPIACLLTEGWRILMVSHFKTRASQVAWVWQLAVVVGMAVLALAMPLRYLPDAFRSPVANNGLLPEAVPFSSSYGDLFQLLGYQLQAGETPATPIDLTLYWQLLSDETPTENYMTLLQLAPSNPEAWIADQTVFLGTGRYPTSQWQAGDLVVQHHRLTAPENAPTPALYWLGVGLVRQPGGERLPVTAGVPASAGNLVRLGPFPLYQSEGVNPTELTTATQYQFGAAIELAGYEVSLNATTGKLILTLYWRALDTITEDWSLFAHLYDESGSLITQIDTPPLQGALPTSWWRPDDLLIDRHEIPLPAEIDQLPLTLHVGLYLPEGGTRLPVSTALDVPRAGGTKSTADSVIILLAP